MKLGIVGGALQGMEAAYLARKAGYETLVVDRRTDAPALSLADEAVVLDVTLERGRAAKVLEDCDAVLPANENYAALICLSDMFRELETPLLFDMRAYEISSSKLHSNQLFERMGVPVPSPWPNCGFPVVVKPSGQSGSVGVAKASGPEELEMGIEAVRALGEEPIVQEFVEGPNISIEVIGDGARAVPMVITEVVLDAGYDCRMVRCPLEGLEPSVEAAFAGIARKIAEGMGLRGIMDVEAIVCGGVPKVLEIDARIPSQTPAAVYHATGVNLLERLVGALVHGRLEDAGPVRQGASVYEHIAADDGRMRSCGERGFAEVRSPRIAPGLFGADDAMTDHRPGARSWRGTLMFSGSTSELVREKRTRCIREIARAEGLEGSEEVI